MEKFLKNQPIPLTQIIDPNTGQAYYSTQNVVYQDKNNTGVTYLKNVRVDQAYTSSYFSGSVSNAISASYATRALSASYAANGGVTQLLAGPNISLSPTNGLGQVTVSATLSGSTIFNTSTGSYGSFYDTTTQTNPVANIARSMSLNSTDITNGVSISGSTNPFNTYIKTQNAGVYNIQFSAQVDKTDGGSDDIVIWLRKNGIDLTDTATTLTLPTNNSKVVAAWNWFVSSATGDYYQIIWRSPDTALRLLAESISVDHPGIPSVIVTANRVDQFLSNTGSFSGSFTGAFTGSFSGSIAAPGSPTQIVFNNGGVLGANSGLVYSGSRVGIGKSDPNTTLDISGSTFISGSTTWALPGNANGYISPGTDGISIGSSNSGVHIRVRNSNRTSFDQSCGFGGAGSFGMTTSDRITVLTGGTTSGQTGLWVGSSANSNIFKVQGDSRVGINLATATSALHVQGTGATSATTALTVQNANTSASLIVDDDRLVTVSSKLQVGTFTPGAATGSSTIFTTGRISAGGGITFRTPIVGDDTFTGFQYGGTGIQVYVSNGIAAQFGGYGGSTDPGITISTNFNPSSGATAKNNFVISTNYQATGTYSGGIRGFYYAPTLTSLASASFHRAIETTSGDIIFGGNTSVILTGSLTVITGSSIEFQVNQTGVKIGNASTDTHSVTGSLVAPSITGSLLGTASYATQALSASFSLTASYIDGGTF